MFWLSYECFSILCFYFLIKGVISSHNICVHFPYSWGRSAPYSDIFTSLKIVFASIYLSKWQVFENLMNTYFCEWLVFWKFQVYKFQPKRKKNKKKTVKLKDIQLMFLSRSVERQAGHDGKTFVIDWF